MGWRDRLLARLPEEVQRDMQDLQPRALTEEDVEAFMVAGIHRQGMATYQEMLLVMDKFSGSDWVRIRHLRKELKWLARKAQSLGIQWTDLSP